MTLNLDRNDIVCRYLYQITVGCDDENCKRAFCRQNQSAKFAGKSIANQSALSLAYHLTAAKGVDELCELLKIETLPGEIVRHFDINDPYNSPVFKQDIKATRQNEKPVNSLANAIFDSDLFKREGAVTSRARNAGNDLSRDENGKKREETEKIEKQKNQMHEKLQIGRKSQAKKHGFVMSTQEELISLLNKKSFNGRAIAYHTCAYLSNSDQISSKPVQSVMFKFWGISLSTAGSWKAPSNSSPWILYSFENPYFYWPTNHPIAAVDVADLKYKKVIYDSYSKLYSLFRVYPDAHSHLHVTDLPKNALKWSREMIRMGFIQKMFCVLHHTAAITKNIAFAHDLMSYSGIHKQDRDKKLIESFPTTLCNEAVFRMEVDRANLLTDACECLKRNLQVDDMILRPMFMKFKNEMSDDHGGVQQEFFGILGKCMIDSPHDLFYNDDSNYMWFNTGYQGEETNYFYVGILVALGFYNQCVVSVQFPRTLYLLLQQERKCPITQEQAQALFEELTPTGKKHMDDLAASQKFDEFYFERDIKDKSGSNGYVTHRFPSFHLYKDGKVTAKNFDIYRREYIFHYCFGKDARKFKLFRKGFQYCVGTELINKISYIKLQELIEGTSLLSVDDLMKNSQNFQDHPIIDEFWGIVRAFNKEQLELLLMFLTGSRRFPANGVLPVKISIYTSDNTDHLPTIATCSGMFVIPIYKSKDILKAKLLKALEYVNGFGLV